MDGIPVLTIFWQKKDLKLLKRMYVMPAAGGRIYSKTLELQPICTHQKEGKRRKERGKKEEKEREKGREEKEERERKEERKGEEGRGEERKREEKARKTEAETKTKER